VPFMEESANFDVSIPVLFFYYSKIWCSRLFFFVVAFFFFFWFLPHFNLHKICQMQTVDMFPKKALEALKDIR